MKHQDVLLASLLAASGLVVPAAQAAINWTGTANYTVAPGSGTDEEAVGPFDTYDLGSGVVLLENTGGTNYAGFYQAFVTNHELSAITVSAPKLNNTYELTVVASFTETVTAVGGGGSVITVTGGSFDVYFDTNVNHDFAIDGTFTDGASILSGTILSGVGSAVTAGSMIFGATDITVQVTSFNTSVFEPDTIAGAGGIFTLRLGSPYDATLLSSVTKVNGHTVDGTDLLFAADGNVMLAVPEAETYAMMLAGLGLVGFMARRRAHSAV